MSLTHEQMVAALPPQMKKRLSEDNVANINAALDDGIHTEVLKDNFIGYLSVVKNGRFSIDEYLNAVKYVSYKMMGDTNKAAYVKTFRERYSRMQADNIADKDINRAISIYNKGKLVNLIFEQTLTPTHILNADVFQKAINIQAEIMSDEEVSPKVRSDAANSLLTHLKRPETQKVELDVNIKEDSMLQELKDITSGLAAQQRKLIEGGAYTAKDIAHQQILTVEQDDDGNYS